MTRVLKRPMFRLGGNTDQGIMSGVVPKQGYKMPGLVEQLPELQKIAKQIGKVDKKDSKALMEIARKLATADSTTGLEKDGK